ncbi:MAG: hypothetical protein WD066_03640 [Planctomycetaceae bacterium]
MACDIVHDESGTLEYGIFYEFGVQFDDFEIEGDRDITWAVSSRPQPNFETIFLNGEVFHIGTVAEGYLHEFECPRSKSHETATFVNRKNTLMDLGGGAVVSEFIPSCSDLCVVSESFAIRSRATRLTGMDFFPMVINVNQSATEETGAPNLLGLEFAGRVWLRPYILVDKPNACPFCGDGPIICDNCWHVDDRCDACGERTVVGPTGNVASGSLVMQLQPDEGYILQGKSWDGRDFVQARGHKFVTARALHWLCVAHARPFWARPARVWTDGMTDEQYRWMERARDSTSL